MVVPKLKLSDMGHVIFIQSTVTNILPIVINYVHSFTILTINFMYDLNFKKSWTFTLIIPSQILVLSSANTIVY